MNEEIKICLLCIIFFFFLSCGQREKESSEEVENPNVEIPKDQVPSIAINEKPKSNEFKDALDEQSPAGLKIGEYYASDDNEYVFCMDGTLKFDSSPDIYMLGNWKMKGDTILLFYTKLVGKKGIGKPLPAPYPPPGNYFDRYESYENYEEVIEEKEQLSWSEIRNFIREDREYPYKILETNTDCSNIKKFRLDD
jgi:hypothetical protein